MQISSSGPPGDPPTPDQIVKRMRRAHPPDNEVPAVLAWSALLGRNDDLAVALVGVWVYTTGMRLDVVVRTRRLFQPGDHSFHAAVTGRPGATTDRLLLGVQYPDGRVAIAANPGVAWASGQRPDDEPTLSASSSSGSGRSVNAMLFLSPIPSPGPLTIYCAWPSRDIAETRTVLDGAALTQAREQIVVLWPAETEPPLQPPAPPARPDVPDDGWFASVLRSPTQHDQLY